MYNLALCYELETFGPETNLEKAFYWYQKAAEKDSIKAMCRLGSCYEKGKGTEKNLEKASYWHQIAAESNKTNSKNEEDLVKFIKLPGQMGLSLAGILKNNNGIDKHVMRLFLKHLIIHQV
ncbi:hypothetical protein C1646_698782 [Rhizophagus diaphanus]|nr:hypothetical protein C1646_698782 [Rhizophagus diaphanus] [Rhizophagus sp. MUCL 43196]